MRHHGLFTRPLVVSGQTNSFYPLRLVKRGITVEISCEVDIYSRLYKYMRNLLIHGLERAEIAKLELGPASSCDDSNAGTSSLVERMAGQKTGQKTRLRSVVIGISRLGMKASISSS